jgi:hypothetical protein
MRGLFDLERPGVYQLLIGPTSAAISIDCCCHRAPPDDLCMAWIHALLPPAAAVIVAALQGVRGQAAAPGRSAHQITPCGCTMRNSKGPS